MHEVNASARADGEYVRISLLLSAALHLHWLCLHLHRLNSVLLHPAEGRCQQGRQQIRKRRRIGSSREESAVQERRIGYIYTLKKGDNRHISSVKELGRRARASRIHLSRRPWVKTNTFYWQVSVQHNQTSHAPHNHRRWLAAHRCYPELATTTDRSPVKSQRAKQASEKEAMIFVFRGAACGGAGSWRHKIFGHSRDCADKI